MIRLILKTDEGGDVVRSFDLPVVSIGRGAGADLRIADMRVSSLHGEIVFSAGAYKYRDLRSTNGSMVRRSKERIVVDGTNIPEVVLHDADEILLGDAANPVRLQVFIEPEQDHQDQLFKSTETVIASRAVASLPSLASSMDRKALSSLLSFVQDVSSLQNANEVIAKLAAFLLDNLSAAFQIVIVTPGQGGLDSGIDLELHVDKNGPGKSSNRRAAQELARLLKNAEKKRTSLLLEPGSLENKDFGSLICVPMFDLQTASNESRLLAGLFADSSSTSKFDRADLDLTSAACCHASSILANLRLVERLKEAEERLAARCEHLAGELERSTGGRDIVGKSPELEEVLKQARAVAPTGTTVLLMGETGTGKEILARRIHELSPRAGSIFAAVNCAAIPSGLLETELFGHLRGSFTGAVKDKKGMFEIAHNGTLFLDEIGELPMELQVKLLRVLQEGEVLPVGATSPRQVDVRLIAATNKDLAKEVEHGRFREDLFYRVSVFPITLPPLRQRPGDALLIAGYYLKKLEARHNRGPKKLSNASKKAISGYSWPGNIRELFNELERAYLMADREEIIDVHHFSQNLSENESRHAEDKPKSLKEILEVREREVIRKVLAEHNGNRTHAARVLGISRQALILKIAKLGI
ncbi:MAG: FHA domain-containing protein [Deltaproteobacteria bacterium]|nr:FHA domain-containing protein [Deltaproteobacteria bacterium]